MVRVGLTGNAGSGKSTVARCWAGLGAAVVDADALAREAVAPGTPGLAAVRDAFGDDVVVDGRLDRGALRRIVFADPEARTRLEGIVHPIVARLREREEARLEAEGAGLVVHEIPLLFEAGLEDEVDLIVLVDAPSEIRVDRLVRDRGLGRGEARAVIGSQMPSGQKRDRADIVIDNGGSLDTLRAAAATVWERIQRMAERGGEEGGR